MSLISANSGAVSASDIDFHFSAAQSDSDFEVVLVTRTTSLSDSDSASLISAPTDDSSDEEHIFIPNTAPNTPRPPQLPSRLLATPRPVSAAIARPIVEHGHDSDASDREDSSDSSYDSDGSVCALKIARHHNGSAATIRRPCRPVPAGMHTPAITTNTIAGIVASASPPTPSDGEIPYAPFTAAPTAVSVPIPIASLPQHAPSIPSGEITRKMWANMNMARIELGLSPLEHALRKSLNEEHAKKNKAKPAAESKTPPKSKSKSKAKAKPAKPKANALVAPRPTVGGSPVSSEDESSRARVSIFSPVNDISVRSDSPDEEAYDEAIKQLDEHMSSPPENPTAAYRYLLNRALLLEFRICTPDTLPTSHGAAIAMVKANVHINILDYVAKRKQGFKGLRTAMLASAKALRKDVRKRRMPVNKAKSLGLHSLLVQK